MRTKLGKLRKLDLPTLRAAWWAFRSVRRVRRDLSRRKLEEIELPPVPEVSPQAERGMRVVLSRRRPTCLVRSTVRQAWHAAHGSPRDLVIGVTAPAEGFRAHAWLEGDPPAHSDGYVELHRLPADPSHAGT